MEAPRSEDELFERARRISGRTLGELAERLERPIPQSLARDKGWVGGLVERALGASAGSRAAPDFEALGVELKSVPVSRAGRPRESTFLTSIAPRALVELPWARSTVRTKLARVLWIPVEADPKIALAARRLGQPLLWSPSAADDAALEADYEELRRVSSEGYLDAITAHRGQLLQIRPKAKDARARRLTPDADGHDSLALPRGFYLRARFVAQIFAAHFHPASTRPARLTRGPSRATEGSS